MLTSQAYIDRINDSILSNLTTGKECTSKLITDTPFNWDKINEDKHPVTKLELGGSRIEVCVSPSKTMLQEAKAKGQPIYMFNLEQKAATSSQEPQDVAASSKKSQKAATSSQEPHEDVAAPSKKKAETSSQEPHGDVAAPSKKKAETSSQEPHGDVAAPSKKKAATSSQEPHGDVAASSKKKAATSSHAGTAWRCCSV